jgi:hypothetical protein
MVEEKYGNLEKLLGVTLFCPTPHLAGRNFSKTDF